MEIKELGCVSAVRRGEELRAGGSGDMGLGT
jgi:hypothetical protein